MGKYIVTIIVNAKSLEEAAKKRRGEVVEVSLTKEEERDEKGKISGLGFIHEKKKK